MTPYDALVGISVEASLLVLPALVVPGYLVLLGFAVARGHRLPEPAFYTVASMVGLGLLTATCGLAVDDGHIARYVQRGSLLTVHAGRLAAFAALLLLGSLSAGVAGGLVLRTSKALIASVRRRRLESVASRSTAAATEAPGPVSLLPRTVSPHPADRRSDRVPREEIRPGAGGGPPTSSEGAEEGLWYRWIPENASSVAYSDVASAVERFEGLDTPAGRAATRWLQEESLAAYPSTVPYVMLANGRIDAFFALSSTSITLTQRHRKQLGLTDPADIKRPVQGAVRVDWIARHQQAGPGVGRNALLHALSVAHNAAKAIGAVALVIDAADDDTAALFTGQYGFRRTADPSSSTTRLWIPLQGAETSVTPSAGTAL
jgi:hypothetical protein